MKDRQQDIARTAQWTVDKLADRMQQPPEPISDATHGDGFAFSLNENGESRFLDIYPQANAVHITTPDVEIIFRNALPPRPAKEGVLIESADGHSHALFLRNGHVAVEVFPFQAVKALESPTGIPDAQDGQILDSGQSIVPGGAGSEIAASPDASPQPVARTEKQPKVSWTGYVSADPIFSTSNDGTPRVNMVVSEHLEDEKTVYHKVYSTKREAKRLQDAELAKGNRVKVEGYKQDRERKNRDGTITPEQRVYAVHVTIYKTGESKESSSPPPNTDLTAQE